MFAVVDIKGFQEIVKEGDILRVPSLNEEKGKKVTFDKVLMVAGDQMNIGAPTVGGATVEAEVVSNGRTSKVRVYRMRRRKRFRRLKGHRQGFTEIKVMRIVVK